MNDSLTLPGRGIRPLASLAAHRRLAVAVGLLVLLLGLPVAWQKGAPRYLTEATLQVSPRYMRNLHEDQELQFQSNTQYRQFVEHQRRSIGRHDVLTEAFAQLGEQRALWQRPGESERRAVDRLRAQLQVASVPDTYLLRVRLEGGRPEGLAETVNAVTASFVERMKAEEIYGVDERARQLREREGQLLERIASMGAERAGIAQLLSLTTFNEATPNPFDQLVASQRASLAEAKRRRLEAEEALAAFGARGDTHITVRSVQDAVLNDPGLNGLKGALSTRRAELLTRASGLRAEHPQRVAAEREIAEMDTEMRNQRERLERDVRTNLGARLLGSAEQARGVETGLAQDLAALEGRASEFAQQFQAAMTLTSDIAHARSELDKLRERLNVLEVESSSFGFLRIVSPALIPDLPFGPGRKKLLLMVLLAALGAAGVAPVLRDLIDRRLHTVNDVHRVLGIAPAGWQVDRGDAVSQVFGDEQLRRLSAALLRSRDARAQHVFGFTGCKPGAGTTTLVIELALTLQALGHRVLVVAAHGTGAPSGSGDGRPGLRELLRGQATPDEVTAPATDAVPARVAACAETDAGPFVLERLDRLQEALQTWSKSYDFVLVDMPPLLTRADAELLVRTLGHVLLVVEAGAVTRGEAQRAGRLLQALDPEGVGVVVNRVAPFAAGGYMRDLMQESLSGRRAASTPTPSRWRLSLPGWLMTPQRGQA